MDAYIDGACRNNQEADKDKVSSAVGVYIPDMNIKFGAVTGSKTSNEAEYDALIEALKIARKRGINELYIFSDSNLIVNQVNGRINDLPGHWKINEPRLRKKMNQVLELSKGMDIELNKIPREENNMADGLANDALDEADLP